MKNILMQIADAVFENKNIDTSLLLIKLDMELYEKNIIIVPEYVLDEMLNILEQTTDENNVCGWEVFVWIERVFPKLNELQKEKVKNFIAKNYGVFKQDALVLEMAEWVGGFQNEWAIKTVQYWLSIKLSECAFYHLKGAFRELLSTSYSNDHLLNLILKLKQKYEQSGS